LGSCVGHVGRGGGGEGGGGAVAARHWGAGLCGARMSSFRHVLTGLTCRFVVSVLHMLGPAVTYDARRAASRM
jgi:hypothetical protein